MPRRRGRPARPLPIHPERVISIAMQTGLSSTVQLQRAIKNKTTSKHYRSSDEIWKIARQVYLLTKERGNPDYSYILKAEPQIRDNNLKMLNEKAAEFGFTEVQRQRNSDGTVGPHNARQNICGANLREFSEMDFPLPKSIKFGTRTRRDGVKRRKFRVAGYEGTSFGPRVILSHPDLPSLDFGDAARSHNEYLATFCTIHDVPERETSRYSNLLLLLTRPYLEHIYSEYNCGRLGFRNGIIEALGKVKDLITDAGYQPTMRVDRSVTSTLEYDQGEVSIDFTDVQYDEFLQLYGDSPVLREIKRLKQTGFYRSPGVIEPCITVKDVEYIREQAIKRGQLKGSIMHRRIENLFPTPWDLRDAIFQGHEYTRSSEYLIVSEVPLDTDSGRGKVDITLLERVVTTDGKKALYRPALACEIKTRMGHKWYLDAIQKASESRGTDGIPQRVIAEFPLQDRSLEEKEWKSIVDSTPYKNARTQVAIYAEALAQRFQEVTGEETAHVFRATIMIEAITDINQIRRIIEGLVIKAYEFLKKIKGNVKRTIITPSNDSDCKVVLVIHKQRVLRKSQSKRVESPWSPPYNPFHQNEESDRRFILYLTGESPTSAGTSAAYNARNYHGLQILYQMKMNIPNARFLWLDLADQFVEPKLAEARLRLRPRRCTPEEEVKAHYDHIRNFFEQIEVKAHLNSILSHLYDDGLEPTFDIEKEPDRPLVIVVSGIDVLKNATPETHRNQLQIILDRLLASLPDEDDTTVLWFDSPVPSAEKSIPYATRALLPYYSSSSLAEYTTEVVWNLPSPPRSAVEPEKWTLPSIGDTPIYDDIRLIVTHTREKVDIRFESIPSLQGWSKRFKNQGSGLVYRERTEKNAFPEKDLRERMKLLALTLIPYIVRLNPKNKFLGELSKTLEEQYDELIQEFKGSPEDVIVSVETTDNPPSIGPSTLALLRFRQPDIRSGKAYVAMTLGRINSQRLYRSPLKLQTRPRQRSEAPELISDASVIEEKLESEWVLGIEFQSGETGTHRWTVLQDPKKSSRMLVGCFSNRPSKEDEYWAETKQEILVQQTLDDILGYKQVIIACRETEQGLEVWFIDPDNDDREFGGLLEVIRKGYSSVSQLQGIKLTEAQSITEPPLDFRLPEEFYQRVSDALRRYLNSVTSPISISVLLEREEDVCRVAFVDKDGDILQEVEHESVPDLLRLLRWPMIHAGPMYTDAGEYVTWNVFDDIKYSNLDFLRPYIIFSATRATPEELPSRVSQFFEDAEELTVEIEHDESVCPIALGKEDEHGACWYIKLPADAPKRLERQLDGYKTGREIHGLLAPRCIWSGKLYKLEVSFSHKADTPECMVFQEEKWIRLLLREFDHVLSSVPPGSYLRAEEEEWVVSITSGKREVGWYAISTATGKPFHPFYTTYEFDFTNDLKEEKGRILTLILERVGITLDEINNLQEAEKRLTKILEADGFGVTSPPCEVTIEYTDSQYSVILSLDSDIRSLEIRRESFDIDKTDTREKVEEGFSDLFSHEWSSCFNIINEEDANRQFKEALDSFGLSNSCDDPQDEDGTGPLQLRVYEEYDCLKWIVRDEQGEKVADGVFLYDAVESISVYSIEEIRNLIEAEVKEMKERIANLDEVLESELEEVIEELGES
ncbi:MAG: hypothetical protein P1Q69_00945 [Candidatus Thorarchaeota archaeon]|nr:hypothetical protein [Candidatus Thorarchaeota archaeon]